MATVVHAATRQEFFQNLLQRLTALVAKFCFRQCLVAAFWTDIRLLFHLGAAIHAEVGACRQVVAALQAFVDSYYLVAAV